MVEDKHQDFRQSLHLSMIFGFNDYKDSKYIHFKIASMLFSTFSKFKLTNIPVSISKKVTLNAETPHDIILSPFKLHTNVSCLLSNCSCAINEPSTNEHKKWLWLTVKVTQDKQCLAKVLYYFKFIIRLTVFYFNFIKTFIYYDNLISHVESLN